MANRRKPHELKVISGSYRADRDGPLTQNSLPGFGDPSPPDCLGQIGQEVWARTLLTLLQMRVLAQADRDALLIYCQCWERKAAYDEALKDGETYCLPNGTQAIRPEAKRRDQCERQIEKFAKQFGLNPASRTSLNVQAQAGAGMMGGLELYKLTGTDTPNLTETERQELIATAFLSMDEQDRRNAHAVLARDPVYQATVNGQKPKRVETRNRNPPNNGLAAGG